MTIINENLDYMDLEGMLEPNVSIDEYAASIGEDKDIITLSFTVNSRLAGEDLVSWFERGYDFVLVASVSPGELKPGKYLLFIEIERRSKAPERIMELLKDLETLTGFKISDWTISYKKEEFEANEEDLRREMILNPNLYRSEKEEAELNEYRQIANLHNKDIYDDSEHTKMVKMLAGL